MNDSALLLRHSRHLVVAGLGDRDVRRAAERGELVRVASGTYFPSSAWCELGGGERTALRTVAALQRLDRRLVASHSSAAAVWGFPERSTTCEPPISLGRSAPRAQPWRPDVVHVIDSGRSTSNRTPTLARHSMALVDDEVTRHSGVRVTTPARTAVDIALSSPFETALMTFDHGLRLGLFTRESARELLERRSAAPRRLLARRALDLASPLAGSAAESLSRAAMIEAGLPMPVLRQSFHDADGEIGDVAFWWPTVGVIGEIDVHPRCASSTRFVPSAPTSAAVDAMHRDERLRSALGVTSVVRWNGREVDDPARVIAKLARAGLVEGETRRRRGSALGAPARP